MRSQRPGFALGTGATLKEPVLLAESGVGLCFHVSCAGYGYTWFGKDVVASTVILSVSKFQCSWLYLISWILSYLYDPVILGVSELLLSWASSGCCERSGTASVKSLLGHWFRLDGTRSLDWAKVPVSLYPRIPSYSRCWGRYCVLTCDPECVRTPGSWACSGHNDIVW